MVSLSPSQNFPQSLRRGWQLGDCTGMRMASSTALAMAAPTTVMPLSPAPLMARARTKSSKPDLLAKFVSVPIYNEVGAGPAEREIVSAGCSGEWMTLIEDLDLATYCGRIGNLNTRHGFCPPFAVPCHT